MEFAEEQNEVLKYLNVEKEPEFPGGQNDLFKYIAAMNYPEQAVKEKIQGKTYLSFVIEKDGSIGLVEIMRSSGSILLGDAAVKHIKAMPH